MALNDCGTYPTDIYCQCYSQKGTPTPHFQQFNEEEQEFLCCNDIRPSLARLRDWDGNNAGNKILENVSGPFEFFESIYENGLTGCCYLPYFQSSPSAPSSQAYFTENYPDLHNNYQVTATLYDDFMAGTDKLPTNTNQTVSCPLSTDVPYVLYYKSSGQTNYNYSFICASDSDLNPKLQLNGKYIDYHTQRFTNNSTGKPCTGNNCPLLVNNFGNYANLGNSQPFYTNNPKSTTTGSIVSLVASVIVFIVICFVLHKNFKVKRIS
jgi:hypothetical protein